MSSSQAVCSGDSPIQHFLVLMLENRSFDHFLGWLKQYNPLINGLTGSEFNYVDPSSPSTSEKIFVNQLGSNVDPDFDHSVPGTTQEIQWGASGQTVTQALMNGFVGQNDEHVVSKGAQALSMFNRTSLPILTTLAMNFAIFDAWFADVPGPTMPNRFYFMSGTSHGLADNNVDHIAIGLPQESIFDRLNQWNVDWRVYAESVPSVLGLRRMREPKNLERLRDIREFRQNLNEHTLPPFSWIEPCYWAVPEEDIVPRDQHPDHPVVYGEELIKFIYENLRQSDYWNCSALMVVYDEHGGYYDHQPMELTNVPNPDGRNAKNPPFDFNRLGIRVPAVIASPWLDPSVINTPDPSVRPFPNSQFSHSSLAATLQKLFGPGGAPLTNRTAWSAPFDYVFNQRKTPRTDTPSTLPPVFQTEFFQDKPRHYSADLPMNEFQLQLLGIARQLCLDNPQVCLDPVPSNEEIARFTEADGGRFALRVLRSLSLFPLSKEKWL